MASANVVTFSAGALTEENLKGKGFVLVDFWASWCGPCRMVAPIVDQLADDYKGKVTVGKLNIDEHPDAAFRYGVQSIPTLILFNDGKVVENMLGARGKPAFVEILNKHLPK